MLPPFDQIACTVTWTDPVTAAVERHTITLADLKLRPIDALYLLKPDNVQAMAEIDDRIQRHVAATWTPRPDALMQIQYRTASPGQFSVFESGPLLRNLRSLLTQSRPLRATDVLRANDASQNDDSSGLPRSETASPLRWQRSPRSRTTSTTSSAPRSRRCWPTPPRTARNHRPSRLEHLADAVALLERAARLALPSSGWGFLYAWSQQAFADLLAQIADLVVRWTQKLTDFDDALTAYDGLPAATSDADRFATLQAAELTVSTRLDPLPATPALMRAALPAKATALQNRLAQFQAIQNGCWRLLRHIWSSSATTLTTAEFDSQPFDVSAIADRAITITQDISRALTSQSADANTRIAAVNCELGTQASSVTSASDQVAAVVAAAKALLGDDFQHHSGIHGLGRRKAPSGPTQSTHPRRATCSSTRKTTLKHRLPRRRVVLRRSTRSPAAPLLGDGAHAVVGLRSHAAARSPRFNCRSLPASRGARSSFPTQPALTSDRLLYTCLYSQAFDPAARQCGVLVDEWTEVIPATTRDTGHHL